MIVGHTHDEVDQLFSILAQTLKGTEVSTLDELVNALGLPQSNPNHW
jgi:hypothetical protein